MTDAAVPDRPGFHLVDPSPWPLVGAAFAFLTAFGLILFMHGSSFGPGLLTIGVAGILFTMAGWWRDVVSEAQGGYHNIIVRHGLTLGMILFIASEVMFFVAWFWAFFWNALNPADPQTYGLLDFSGGIWPPKGTEVIDPLALPLMNTFVLLTSSAAVNVAHDELREGHRRQVQDSFLRSASRLACCSSSPRPTNISTRRSALRIRSTARPSSWRPAFTARTSSSA